MYMCLVVAGTFSNVSAGLMGPIPTTEDTQEEDQGIDLGNLSPSYARILYSSYKEFTRIIPIDHLPFMKERKRLNQTCIHVFACFLSSRRTNTRVSKALSDPAWVEAMQEELLQFKLQNVWVLVDLPKGHRAIGTKWVYRNKKDERGIVVRNKARLVAQGHTQEEGIDYDEVFALVARIEAIRIFLAYASYMGFTIYVDDIIFGSTKKELCVCDRVFEKLMRISSDEFSADDVDEHLFCSMIGYFMYLTASRTDIMFAVVFGILRILHWVSCLYCSDLLVATLSIGSNTGGCSIFGIGNRLSLGVQGKQNVVATSTTEADCGGANCCGQVLGYKTIA
ncbi:ribonuclease H-like domain-containing protein [Tanacetum coccineum]